MTTQPEFTMNGVDTKSRASLKLYLALFPSKRSLLKFARIDAVIASPYQARVARVDHHTCDVRLRTEAQRCSALRLGLQLCAHKHIAKLQQEPRTTADSVVTSELDAYTTQCPLEVSAGSMLDNSELSLARYCAGQ